MNNPWSAIEKPSSDFNVRLVDEAHPLKLFWGVDTQRRYLFAYDATVTCLPEKKALPRLSGIELYVVPQGARGKLVLVLQDNANWELFYALCSDLVRATGDVKDESAAAIVIIRRLQRWQELLRRTRPRTLSPEEIKGLMGELLFLKTTLPGTFHPWRRDATPGCHQANPPPSIARPPPPGLSSAASKTVSAPSCRKRRSAPSSAQNPSSSPPAPLIAGKQPGLPPASISAL